MSVYIATTQCLKHGLIVSLETKDAQIVIVGTDCGCPKTSYWKVVPPEMMGELEEMLDKQRHKGARV